MLNPHRNYLVTNPLCCTGEVAVTGLAVGILVRAIAAVVTGSTLNILGTVTLSRVLATTHVSFIDR